ncbi:hypothetical protein REPUB_Repub02eG0212900 [Reevesia pubescens]
MPLKQAVAGLIESLSVELGEYGITVNCVSPYVVVTPLFHEVTGILDKRKAEEFVFAFAVLKGPILEPEGIADAALYLASDDAKYVSGVNLVVDGAFSLNNQSWKMGLENYIPE